MQRSREDRERVRPRDHIASVPGSSLASPIDDIIDTGTPVAQFNLPDTGVNAPINTGTLIEATDASQDDGATVDQEEP